MSGRPCGGFKGLLVLAQHASHVGLKAEQLLAPPAAPGPPSGRVPWRRGSAGRGPPRAYAGSAGGTSKPGLPVHDHLGDAADVGADDRQGVRAIASRVAFPSGSTWDGTAATSEAVSQSADVLLEPDEPRGDTELPGQSLHCDAVSPLPGRSSPTTTSSAAARQVGRQQRPGPDQVRDPLRSMTWPAIVTTTRSAGRPSRSRARRRSASPGQAAAAGRRRRPRTGPRSRADAPHISPIKARETNRCRSAPNLLSQSIAGPAEREPVVADARDAQAAGPRRRRSGASAGRCCGRRPGALTEHTPEPPSGQGVPQASATCR